MKVRRIVFATTAGSLSAIVALACSSREEQFVTTDGGTEASLPPSADSDGEAPDVEASPAPPDKPVVCAVSPCVTQITAGKDHYCARIDDGTVRCWGKNTRGQLGFEEDVDGGAADAGLPSRPVVGLAKVTQVSAAGDVSCARLDSGEVTCWGGNESGALGYVDGGFEDTSPHPVPTTVALPGPAARVDVLVAGGWPLACATLSTGEPWCWGYNWNDVGFLARSTFDGGVLVASPGLADRLVPFGRLRFGQSLTLAITEDQKLVVWGFASGRESSPRSPRSTLAYPVVLPLTQVTDVASTFAYACAIVEGHVECWRHAHERSYICDGTGLREDPTLPKRARTRGAAHPRELIAHSGDYGACVRMSDGTVQCCGSNVNGALGTGTVDGGATLIFAEASALEGHVVQLAGSMESTCALLETGEVKCWGGNRNGELGQGTKDDDAHPMPLMVQL